MIVLDTSLIISFFDEEDVLHQKAVKAFEEFEKGGDQLLLTDYVLNETVSVTLRKGSLDKSKELLEFLLEYKNMEIFHVDANGFREVIKVFREQKDNLSFIDCSLLWLAHAYGFRVETFDKNLLSELEKIKETRRSRR
ncbi:MAG: PIN domain-containing protein [Candidatus ainarchaeum sp.]|nr:PIN domain-containing protein [Candidatus ainarchaeum sp.]